MSDDLMFSRVIRMTIIGDATTWSITYNDSGDVIYEFL